MGPLEASRGSQTHFRNSRRVSGGYIEILGVFQGFPGGFGAPEGCFKVFQGVSRTFLWVPRRFRGSLSECFYKLLKPLATLFIWAFKRTFSFLHQMKWVNAFIYWLTCRCWLYRYFYHRHRLKCSWSVVICCAHSLNFRKLFNFCKVAWHFHSMNLWNLKWHLFFCWNRY